MLRQTAMKWLVWEALLWAVSIPSTQAGFSGKGAGPDETLNWKCKCLPGDSCWPDRSEWDALNSTVGGRLIETVPLGSPCHLEHGNYDEERCQQLRDEWQYSGVHMADSSSVMAPFFANQSCDPFQPKESPCTLGNYVVYSVDARTAADVQATIRFAKEHNVRFVIRNTGHDYNGRSTGAGALSVWTHHMKEIELLDWDDQDDNRDGAYRGKALRVAAGVQGFEAMDAAHAAGRVVVGGECPTVGLAGGYTQGGGHSALSTSFGLSADNVLEYEVVTADAAIVKANRQENADLYWALSGGGGGNWGVATRTTFRAHPDTIVGGASVSFTAGDGDGGEAAFYAAIDVFHEELGGIVDGGAMVIYFFGKGFFQIAPLTARGKGEAEVRAMLAPFLARLEGLGVAHAASYSEHATYRQHYDAYLGPLPVGNIQVGIAQYGGRLVPRRSVTNLTSFARALGGRDDGAIFIGVGTDVGPFGGGKGGNAVLPAWREALVHATLTTPWDFAAPWEDMVALQRVMTEELMPQIEAVTPGGGAYMNEADFRQPRWQQEFFGTNYERLREIKDRWDPEGFFYALTGVGSEKWHVAPDGRMCAVAGGSEPVASRDEL